MNETRFKFQYCSSIGLGSNALVTNFLQLVLTIRKKQLFRNFDVSVYFVILTAAMGIIIHVILIVIVGYKLDSGYLLEIGATVMSFAVNSAALHVSFIASQRLLAVFRPIKFRIFLKRKQCLIVIFVIWIVSALLSFPWTMPHSYLLVRCVIISSGLVLILSYLLLFFRMKKRHSIASSSNGINKKVYFHSLAVTLMFLICQIPFVVYLFTEKADVFYAFPHLLYLNASLDPVIYFYVNQRSMEHLLECFGQRKMDYNTETRTVAAIPVTAVSNTKRHENTSV